jgi:Rieske Fe-S protein
VDASRREFVRRMIAASVLLGVSGVAIWDILEGQLGPAGGAAQVTLLQASTTTQMASSGPAQGTTQAVPAGYVFVTAMGALSGKSSAYFNHPSGGLSLLLNLNGQWKAFSATCTHAPCTVQFASSQIQCPCHGGTFNPSNGSVTGGPPPVSLPEYGVLVQGNNLYVTNSRVN